VTRVREIQERVLWDMMAVARPHHPPPERIGKYVVIIKLVKNHPCRVSVEKMQASVQVQNPELSLSSTP